MTKPGIMLAMPLGQPGIHIECVVGVIETVMNWPTDFRVRRGSYLPHNRAHLLQDFLEHDKATHMLCVDSDVGFRPQHVKALLDANLGAVGGIYASKDIPPRATHEQSEGARRGQCVPVSRMAFGFVLFQRATLELFVNAQKSVVHQGRVLPEVFTPEGGTGDTEDWAFWRRWISAGLPAYIHQGVVLPHFGDAPFLPPGGAR